ncbi:MAG: hypothetical protein ACHQ06_05645 [Candidatus Dormibacteria bacterium]|jgi:hypothetical protein
MKLLRARYLAVVLGAVVALLIGGSTTIAADGQDNSGQGHDRSAAPTWKGEVDNGTEFALAHAPLADTSNGVTSYADTGVVQDVGTVGSLTSSSIAYKGSASTGTLLENIWIGDGAQASTPGIYPLSSVDFCYGLGQNYSNGAPTEFYMTGAHCGSYSPAVVPGSTLTLSQITSDFPATLEAYAWVGVTSNGSSTPSGSVSRVGHQTVDATFGFISNPGDGTLTAFVRPGN